MATHAEGTFENKGWDENTVERVDDGKISHASVKQAFSGDITGDGESTGTCTTRPTAPRASSACSASIARVGDRTGTIVVQSTGVFDGKEAQGDWVVVGATGDLDGLSGTGEFSAPMGPSGEVHARLRPLMAGARAATSTAAGNVLGAVALAVVDRISEAVADGDATVRHRPRPRCRRCTSSSSGRASTPCAACSA